MGIVNRRNAVLGWTVWRVGKFAVKEKVRQSKPAVDRQTKRPNKAALVAAGAALGTVLLFWRKKGSDDGTPPPE